MRDSDEKRGDACSPGHLRLPRELDSFSEEGGGREAGPCCEIHRVGTQEREDMGKGRPVPHCREELAIHEQIFGDRIVHAILEEHHSFMNHPISGGGGGVGAAIQRFPGKVE